MEKNNASPVGSITPGADLKEVPFFGGPYSGKTMSMAETPPVFKIKTLDGDIRNRYRFDTEPSTVTTHTECYYYTLVWNTEAKDYIYAYVHESVRGLL